MTRRTTLQLGMLLLLMVNTMTAAAKEVKDTLFSADRDRVIITYNLTQDGSQVTVRFSGVMKKISDDRKKKYKKLDEVAVVIFDRTGNFKGTKFDGIATQPFMVPADITYSPSQDGFFLLHDNPTIHFTANSKNATLGMPIYLAHYEGKRHYEVFAQCGTLEVKTKADGGRGSNMGGSQPQDDVVISSEELIDEGLSPVEEAAIRITTLEEMLERASKVPFSEELTHEASMLRELRYKIPADDPVSKQISEALKEYDDKKQELEEEAASNDAAAKAKADADAKALQERQDSIAAAQAQQASDDKKDMMWLIGGIAGLVALFMGGKQVYTTIKNNKMQKMQQQMQQKMQQDMMKKMQELTKSANPMKQAQDTNTAQQAPPQASEQPQAPQQPQTPQQPQEPPQRQFKRAPLAPKPRITPSANEQIPTEFKRMKPKKRPGNDA